MDETERTKDIYRKYRINDIVTRIANAVLSSAYEGGGAVSVP